MTITRSRAIALLGLVVLAASVAGLARLVPVRMGRQPDGSFLVSSGQRIEGGSFAFRGRPIDLALHPRDDVFAVLNKAEVFLVTTNGAGGSPGRPVHHRGRDLGRVPRARLVARRHPALRQHQPGLCPVLHLQGWRAQGRGDDPHPARRGQGEPGPRWDGDHPRRLAALRRRRQPQRRRRDRPGDARIRARVPRSDPALRAEALGG